MILKIHADEEMMDRLTISAVKELRPIQWQAEVILRRALGIQFPKGRELEVQLAPDVPLPVGSVKVEEIS